MPIVPNGKLTANATRSKEGRRKHPVLEENITLTSKELLEKGIRDREYRLCSFDGVYSLLHLITGSA